MSERYEIYMARRVGEYERENTIIFGEEALTLKLHIPYLNPVRWHYLLYLRQVQLSNIASALDALAKVTKYTTTTI